MSTMIETEELTALRAAVSALGRRHAPASTGPRCGPRPGNSATWA